MVQTESLMVPTKGHDDIVDLTAAVEDVVRKHGMDSGQALVFVPGSTAGLTTIEYEDGLLEDLPAMFERIAPRGIRYGHEERWHDGNGHSHVRASLLGPSLTIPFSGGKLLLGTWQQIVLVDFDVRARKREVIVQLTGVRARA